VNWLLDNWKILFSGVAGTAAVALIGYLLKRLWEPKPQPSGLNAQGAKVLESPVASGTGNVQRVNSPDIYHIGSTQPVIPQPRSLEPKAAKPPKRLTTGLTRTLPVSVAQDDRFNVDVDGRPAVLAQFTNEPDEEGQNMQVTAKARVVYYDENDKELCRVNDGCWLRERLNTKTFGYDESHELILCSVLDGVLQAFTNVRTEENYYAEVDEGGDCLAIPGFTAGTVDVRLTNKYTGAVLNHSKYTLTIDPLKATLKTP
jgi:hypothetical protein